MSKTEQAVIEQLLARLQYYILQVARYEAKYGKLDQKK